MGGKIYLVIGTITFILLIIFAIGLILFILDRRDKRGKEEKINKKESMIGEKAYPPTEPKKKNGIPSVVKVLGGFIGIILVAAITATFFREDNNMGLAEIFIIIGLVGIVAFIIMRIVVFSKKQYLKLANIGLVVCLVVFIGSFIIFAVGEDKRRSDFANDAFFENFTIKLTPSDDVQRTPKATDAVSTPTRDIISTQTAEPTASGTPTPEPTPVPTPLPTSVIYSGSGDSVISINNPYDLAVFFISGNSADRHFAVRGYDSADNYTNLFVNTTDSYSGLTLDTDGPTTSFEISAVGEWSIEVRSIRTCKPISSGQTIFGSGDDVLLIEGNSKTAKITGNEASRHFAVKAYGSRDKLLVNTTETYSGTVKLNENPHILEISAVGEWSITID